MCLHPLAQPSEVEYLDCHHGYHTKCVESAMQAMPGGRPRGMACALSYCKAKAFRRSQGFSTDITEDEAEEVLRGAIQQAQHASDESTNASEAGRPVVEYIEDDGVGRPGNTEAHSERPTGVAELSVRNAIDEAERETEAYE